MIQNGTVDELSPVQVQAIELLISGTSVTSTAEQIDTSRSTVHRWLREDFTFRAALNRAKRLLVEEFETRLLSLAEAAVRTVEDAVAAGDMRAALAVLKGTGLLRGNVREFASEDPDTLRRQDEVDVLEVSNDLALRSMVVRL